MDPIEHLEHARLAVGVLAARQRGDVAAATELLASFPGASAVAAGFLTVAELALDVGAARGGPLPLVVLEDIGHGLAASEAAQRPDAG